MTKFRLKILITILPFFLQYNTSFLFAQNDQELTEVNGNFIKLKTQYMKFKAEAEELYKSGQLSGLKNQEQKNKIIKDIINYNERIQDFFVLIANYKMQSQKKIFDDFNKYFLMQNKYKKSVDRLPVFKNLNLLYEASLAINHTLSILTQYLSLDDNIYMIAASKYKEVWRMLENEVIED